MSTAAGPLKDILADTLNNSTMFKLKASITWLVRLPGQQSTDNETNFRDFSMNITPISVHAADAPLGGGGIPRVSALLHTVRERAQKKMEAARAGSSGLTFHRIKEIRFTMLPHPRELTFAER